MLLLGLVSFPILTRVLSEDDYGVLSLIIVATSIAAAVAKTGLSDGIIRYYREFSDAPQQLRTFTSTVVFRGIALAALATVAYLIITPLMERALALPRAAGTAFTIMGAYLFFRPLNMIVLNYLRATGRTIFYNGVFLFIKVAAIGLGLLLLFGFGRQIAAYCAGFAAAELLGALILWTWLLRKYPVSWPAVSGELSWRLISFGLPLLATEVGYLLLIYFDRYVIAMFNGTAALGHYTVGYNLSAYINDLVQFSVASAIVPIYTELYTTHGKPETQRFLARALKYYVIGVIPLCAGYAVVARDAIVILASEKYAPAASFSPLIVCGLVFMGMNYILYAGLYLTKRTNQIMLTMAAAVAVNIGLNLWLVPSWGPLGAATATLVACAISSVLTAVLSFRHLPIRLPWSSVMFYGVSALTMMWLLEKIQISSPWLDLAVKVPMGVLVMLCAMLIRDRQDALGILQLARRRSGAR